MQIMHLTLPSKLFYAFSSCISTSCFISIWAQTILIGRSIFQKHELIFDVSLFTAQPRSLGQLYLEPGGRQLDAKEEYEALKPGVLGFRC